MEYVSNVFSNVTSSLLDLKMHNFETIRFCSIEVMCFRKAVTPNSPVVFFPLKLFFFQKNLEKRNNNDMPLKDTSKSF